MPKTKSKAKPTVAPVSKVVPMIKPGSKKLVVISVIILAIGILGYFGKGFLVAAVVNGQPISRISIDAELEKQGGQKVLDSQVTKILINQELAAKKISIPESEVTAEIKKIEDQLKTQNQTLDSALTAQGMTKTELMAQIKIQKSIEKLLGEDVKINEEEIAKFLEENKQYLPEGKSDSEVKQLAVEQLKQQKLDEKFQTWLSGLQSKAKIYKFVKF
jgi:parvulin-like peptidyl-prolyl isomerase